MSVDHSHEISSHGVTLKINISNVDSDPKDVEELKGNIYAYEKSGEKVIFTSQFTINELRDLYNFLNQYSVIVNSNNNRTGRIIEITAATEVISDLLERADRDDILATLSPIVSSQLTRKDISTLLGRRSTLTQFRDMMENQNSFTEPDWQRFLEDHSWIFGYGLDYRYLGILQRESHISRTALDGSGSVITDFLLSDSRFTKLVELKKPDTPLFESSRNRSDSWKLSKELTYAVSQILAQKANWDYESHSENFGENGERITEETHDVGCILLIGCSSQFTGDNREMGIKRRTFELFRRNLRNIEIILYDELYHRVNRLIEQEED
jgi:hypothetical protein